MTEPDVDVEATAARLRMLREPFPPEQVGKLPRAASRDATKKGHCAECGKWHVLPAVHLDYVGHAAVTDRLLAVDPFWSWEPVAFAADGGPLIRRDGNDLVLWIRLTVCGVTRLGVGIVPASKDERDKQLISDSIRNAAMRFGVALDLWSKENLDDHDADDTPVPARAARPSPATPPDGFETVEQAHDRYEAVKALVAALDKPSRDEFEAWRAQAGLVWPWDAATCNGIDAKLSELVARMEEPF